MVSQFQMYGVSPQLVEKTAVLSGQTLTGNRFFLSELLYNAPVYPGAQTNKTYAVDVFGVTDAPQTYGFESREDAERFVHSTRDEEYAARDLHGNEGRHKRVGLGVPEGMVSRLDGSASPSLAKLLQAQAVAERLLADRGPRPDAGQAPPNPDTKPSSDPAPAPWPTATVPPWPTGPEPLGNDTGTDAVDTGRNENPPGTEEAATDGSDATNSALDKTGYDTDPEN